MSTPPDRLMYRVAEAAEILAFGESVVWELIATRQLDSVKQGASRRITRRALEAYVAMLEAEAEASANGSRPTPDRP